MSVSNTFHDSLKPNLYQSENDRWLRYKSVWVEKKDDGQIFKHVFVPAIDRSNGDVYLDCSTKKLHAKFAVFSYVQPIALTLKTIYHLLLPISIPLEIYQAVKAIKAEEKTVKKVFTASLIAVGKSLADIVRTPMHAIASTIVGIAAAKIGHCAPHLLYDMRKVAAKIDRSLNWGQGDSVWTRFGCFQSLTSIKEVGQRYGKVNLLATVDANQMYGENSIGKKSKPWRNKTNQQMFSYRLTTLGALSKLTEVNVKFLRRNPVIFNDCGKLLDPNVAFITPWFESAENTNTLAFPILSAA